MFCVSSTIGVNAGKLQSGSCLFYNFHVSERPFETIVNASFVCLNWIVILFSIYFSVKMIYHIRKISMAVRAGGTASDSSSQSKPYKKILLLILTNLLCWIPIQFLMIVSLCGFNVGQDVSNWFVVAVMPINSLTNPFLYTIESLWKKKK